MCSRFELNAPPSELAHRFGLDRPPPALNAAEARPTDAALVIDRPPGNDDGPAARLLPWGLAVAWDTKPVINARAETLAEKRTFRPLLGRRCLVPATAYFEWRKVGRARLKNRIRPAATDDGGEVFAFAGLFDGERFTVVTCAAAPAVAPIHDRMPVILAGDAEARWIDPALPFDAVAPLLVPFAGTLAADEQAPPSEKQAELFG